MRQPGGAGPGRSGGAVRGIVRVPGAAALALARLLSALPAPAAAQAPAPAPRPKVVAFTGDLGFVNTAGNTDVTTINAGDKLTVTGGKVVLTQTLALVYGRSEGTVNANSRVAGLRADYQLSARLSAYGLLGYERNRFAGIDRRTDEGLGLALKAVRGVRDELDLEAGAELVQESRFPDPALDATVSDNFVSARTALRFKHTFRKDTYFQQSLEFLPNLETSSDYRINSESAVVAPISTHFGLKAGYLVKYNHAPPSPDLARSDRMFTAGLQVTF